MSSALSTTKLIIARDRDIKDKVCKVCEKTFSPIKGMQVVCGIQCGYQLGRLRNQAKAKKADRADTRKRKEALKSRGDHLKEAQRECNKYIRLRDRHLPCISCGTNKPNIQYCAGHFLTVGGHPELRFNPANIHKQCNKNCNLHLSGNVRLYKVKLEEKIGVEHVEWLEGPHQPQKWTIEEIKEIKQHYKDKCKELE